MIDEVARRTGKKHALSLDDAHFRIRALEGDLVDLTASYEALDNDCETIRDRLDDLEEEVASRRGPVRP